MRERYGLRNNPRFKLENTDWMEEQIEKFLVQNYKSAYPMQVKLFGEFSDSKYLDIDADTLELILQTLQYVNKKR